MMKYKLLWKYPIDVPVFSVSITADGRYIVAGSQMDDNVYLLKNEAGRGELLWGYGTGNGMVESVAITPDGNYIAAGIQGLGFRKNGICLLNREGRVLCEWEYDTVHSCPVSSVALTYDGNYIISREVNDIYLFNKEGEVLWKYVIDGPINYPLFASASITSDGNYIAAGGEEGQVHLLSNEGTLLRTFSTGSVSRIEDVAITQDGKYIAAGGENGIYLLNRDGEVLWVYRTRRILPKNVRHTRYTSVAVTSDGNYIAATIKCDKLCLLSYGLLLWLNRSEIAIPSVAMTPDGKYIAAGGSDNNVYLFQLLNEQ